MFVRCIGPTRWRYCDKVMTEVHKRVYVLPVVEPVSKGITASLGKPETQI